MAERPWSRIANREYEALDLRAHDLLRDVPIHDVWRVALDGGGPGRTIADVQALLRFDSLTNINVVVRFLFALRGTLGRLFGWDEASETDAGSAPGDDSYFHRVPAELRQTSVAEPGSMDGPFRVLYSTANESVGEARNATVHAFSVLSIFPRNGGYDVYWGIYVAEGGAFTRFYMALIAPFRRFLVYPMILSYARRAWSEKYAD